MRTEFSDYCRDKFTICFLIQCLIFPLFLYSQEESPFIPIPLPSSTANEITKYTKYPVNYYSGLPNISIPLYNLKASSFSLPVSLNYHASGIKVHDLAPVTGLGWSVIAGGCITATIKGRFDFTRNRFDIRTKEELEALNLPTDHQFEMLADRGMDAEPDIFSFNFCGFSGQFVLDELFLPHSLKNSSGMVINVFPTYHPVPCGDGDCGYYTVKFILVDQEGNAYHFEEYETVERTEYCRDFDLEHNVLLGHWRVYSSQVPELDGYDQTSWFLARIIPANTIDTVHFKYHDYTYSDQTGYSGSITACVWDDIYCDYQQNQNFQWHPQYEGAFRYSEMEYHSKLLSGIVYSRDSTWLSFSYGHPRIDLPGCMALSKIGIGRKSETIFSWDFTYDYFISDFTMFGQEKMKKRLRLNSLRFRSGDSTVLQPPYHFAYYGDNQDEPKLPPRTVYDGFDHWGYCNSNILPSLGTSPKRIFPCSGQPEFIPDYYFVCLYAVFYNGNPVTWLSATSPMPAYPDGGDRTPRGEFAKAFSLKSIKHPTGGVTSFSYEGNTYKYSFTHGYGSYGGFNTPCGGLRVKSISDSTPGEQAIIREFSYGNGGVLFGLPFYKQPQFQWINNESTFTTCGSTGFTQPDAGGYTLHSNTINPLNGFGSENIGYPEVTEHIKGSTPFQNGKTVYSFTSGIGESCDDEFNIYFAHKQTNGNFPESTFYSEIINQLHPIYPFNFDFTTGELSGNAYRRGQLVSKDIYSNSGLIRSEEIVYDTARLESIVGNRVINFDVDHYFINAYYLQTGRTFPKLKKVTEYFPGTSASVKSVTEEHFNSQHEQLIKRFDTTSTGDPFQTEFHYANDFCDGYIHGGGTPEAFGTMRLFLDNRLSIPMEILKWKNGDLIEARLYTYKTLNSLQSGFAVPYKVYKIENVGPFTMIPTALSYNSSNVMELKKDPKYILQKEYEYDLYGNLTGEIDYCGINTFYFYAYDHSLPVVIIKNGNINAVTAVIAELGDIESLWRSFSDLTNQKQRDSLQTVVSFLHNHPSLSLSQITVYTHKPLIGVTSVSTPDGLTKYFEFDKLGRVERERNKDYQVLFDYKYHFSE